MTTGFAERGCDGSGAQSDPVRDAGLGRQGLAGAAVDLPVVELMCRCPGDVAAERYRARRRSEAHRPADEATLDRIRRSASLMEPLGVGPYLQVDSTAPFDVPTIAAWVRSVVGAAAERAEPDRRHR